MAKSNGGLALALCFWSVVLMGIAVLLRIVFGLIGWYQPANICNYVANICMLAGVIFGGLCYISSVHGSYRILWIVLFIIGVVMGILGLTISFGWVHIGA